MLQRPFQADTKLRLQAGILEIDSVDGRIGNNQVKYKGRAYLDRPGVDMQGYLSVQGDSLADMLGNLWVQGLPDTAVAKLDLGIESGTRGRRRAEVRRIRGL